LYNTTPLNIFLHNNVNARYYFRSTNRTFMPRLGPAVLERLEAYADRFRLRLKVPLNFAARVSGTYALRHSFSCFCDCCEIPDRATQRKIASQGKKAIGRNKVRAKLTGKSEMFSALPCKQKRPYLTPSGYAQESHGK
jgi:hypothetical protein